MSVRSGRYLESKMHLALDHLTVADAYPWEIAALAGKSGLQGSCLFLESMSVLPQMPTYSLIDDKEAMNRTRQALLGNAVSLDLVYPFTVTSRSRSLDFLPALKVAAALNARAINLLVYDRDTDRALCSVNELAIAAGELGMDALIEFYPASAIKSLDQAHALADAVSLPNLGINVDILHLYRSDGNVENLKQYRQHIRFAQLADGPLLAPDDTTFEAAQSRLDLGAGQFNLSAFLKALPAVPVSFEVPNASVLSSANSRIQAFKSHVTKACSRF